MCWKRKSPEPTPKPPKLDVNLEWPDGKGFTQCSAEFLQNSISLETFNPAGSCWFIRERDRLIKEGHTGRAFRSR